MTAHWAWEHVACCPDHAAAGPPPVAAEGFGPDACQQALVRWLSRGEDFPDACGTVEVRETHISYVFLTARSAYKLKKAVRFPFVDFSTLEKRYEGCRAELELNRRLAPHVYLGLIPIRRRADGTFRLGGTRGQVVDYLVHMRRLPQQRMLDRLITQAAVHTRDVEPLVELLVRFYSNLAPCMLRPEEYLDRLHQWVVENGQAFQRLLAGPPQHLAAAAQTAQRLFLKAGAEHLRRRVCDGRIVQGHGDLRPEHICLVQPPVVFDCLEFSPSLRQLDVADELCFLEVECEVLGAAELGRHIRTRCLQACGDRPRAKLLAFFKSYRACVRAKVTALRMQQHPEHASHDESLLHRYLQVAAEHARAISPPLVLLVRGQSGSGKSTLATALAQELAMPLVSTDRVRCELFGNHRPETAWNQGIYNEENRRRVYEALFRQAEASLRHGTGVVLDGTFLEADQLARVQHLARQYGARPVAITCQCAESVAKVRIRRRLQQGSDSSRATEQVRTRQRAPSAVPFDAFEVDTAEPFAQELQTVWDHLQALLKL